MSRPTRTTVQNLTTGDRILGLGLVVNTSLPTDAVDSAGNDVWEVKGMVSTFFDSESEPVIYWTSVLLPSDHQVRVVLGSDNPTPTAVPVVHAVAPDLYANWTKDDLLAHATVENIRGRWSMTKSELIAALS